MSRPGNHRATVAVAGVVAALLLTACGEAEPPPPLATVREQPVVFDVFAEGPLQSAKATPLLVPGQGWSQRQLVWMLPEGSAVEEGDLLARFSTERGELDLAEALIELERNALARAAKNGELAVGQGRVAVDLAQVAVDLAIAERYASADLSTMARNEVLDAVQDVDYLGARRGALRWQRDQASTRGDAALAVLDAQRSSIEGDAARSRADLQALELRAPHAGVMMLTADWSGQKPKVGSSLRAGNEFGRLPDTSALQVELALPQIQAQGVEVGNRIELWPLGRPAQKVESMVDWVASAAKVMSRESPVKYLTIKAAVPADAARRHGWVPGMRLRARVVLLAAPEALSVPNVALRSEAGAYYVQVRDGDDYERREVRLGVRGSARSQVLEGLEPGEQVLLVEGGERNAGTVGAGVADAAAADGNAGDA